MWGKHLVLNIRKCNPTTIRCKKTIEQFSKDLVCRIDMTPYGAPHVVHFGEGNKAGYTLVQLITTSNITAHFVEESNDVYMDVFSCKQFHEHDVMDEVNKAFQPESMESYAFLR